jgi:hypothetical protein
MIGLARAETRLTDTEGATWRPPDANAGRAKNASATACKAELAQSKARQQRGKLCGIVRVPLRTYAH